MGSIIKTHAAYPRAGGEIRRPTESKSILDRKGDTMFNWKEFFKMLRRNIIVIIVILYILFMASFKIWPVW